jgi:hypothetical protein
MVAENIIRQPFGSPLKHLNQAQSDSNSFLPRLQEKPVIRLAFIFYTILFSVFNYF